MKASVLAISVAAMPSQRLTPIPRTKLSEVQAWRNHSSVKPEGGRMNSCGFTETIRVIRIGKNRKPIARYVTSRSASDPRSSRIIAWPPAG